ncbi:hypothetical protein JCM10213_005640 [Rhodosporidiobolus nylandii]
MVANDQQPQQVAGNAQRPLAPPGVLRRLDNFISTRPRLVDCLAAIMVARPAWMRTEEFGFLCALYHSYLTAANAYIAVTAVCNLSPLRSFLAAAATYEDLVRSGATADDMRDARELRLKNAALEADNERLKAEANLPAYQE